MKRKKYIIFHASEVILTEEVYETENIQYASQKIKYLYDGRKRHHFTGTWSCVPIVSDLDLVVSHRFCSTGNN